MGSMKKKALAAVAAVGALSMVLAGCGNKDGAQTAEDGKPVIQVLVQYDSTNRQKVNTNPWIKDLEKDCGCHIEWEVIQQDAWGQQKAAILANGDVPQVAIRAFGPDDTIKFPDYFEELSQHLDQMPNMKKYMEEQPLGRRMVSNLDGTFRVASASFPNKWTSQHWMINKTWLDKLGLQMPTTWDELITVLEAFKTQDPNGNGKADEIPFDLRALGTGGFGWWTPMLALNSTGLVTQAQGGPWQQGYYVEDGKVKSWLTSENLKQVLKFYAELYEKGLVPGDWLTKQTSDYDTEITTGNVGLAFTYQKAGFGDHADEYVSMPTPKATADMADSDLAWDASADYGKYENYHLTIKKDAPNMDTVLKLVDLLYSTKYSVQQYYGDIPDLVEQKDDKTFVVSDKVFADSTVSYSFGQCFAGWFPDDVVIEGDPGMDNLKEADEPYTEIYKNHDEKDNFPIYVKPDSADQTTISNNNTQIFTYATPILSNYMNGKTKDYDGAWDEYVAQVNKLGVEQNTQLWQKWYDEYQKQKF